MEKDGLTGLLPRWLFLFLNWPFVFLRHVWTQNVFIYLFLFHHSNDNFSSVFSAVRSDQHYSRHRVATSFQPGRFRFINKTSILPYNKIFYMLKCNDASLKTSMSVLFLSGVTCVNSYLLTDTFIPVTLWGRWSVKKDITPTETALKPVQHQLGRSRLKVRTAGWAASPRISVKVESVMRNAEQNFVIPTINNLYIFVCSGGAGEQHRAVAELPATDKHFPEPLQPAALLEHVQQVNTHTHTSIVHLNILSLNKTPNVPPRSLI